MAKIIASTYQVIEQIGSGGGGVVYLAYHMRLGKKVVLKADKRKLTTRQELLRREVDILKKLSHTYIPQVYDFFLEDGIVYTVIDYIEGESLDKPLKRGERFSQPQVIQWARQILEALCYLHSPTHGSPPRGFVHSDIKPANLMLRPNGDICLIDFNIALALGEESAIGCSPGYASPEHYGLDYSFSSIGGGSNADAVYIGGRNGAEASRSEGNKRRAYSVTETETETTDRGLPDSETESMTASGQKPSETTATVGIVQTQTDGKQDENGLAKPLHSPKAVSGPPQSSSGYKSRSSRRRAVVPDVRSDIYSVGATLYHLLSGTRPARAATEVTPLSETLFSPQIVQIISRAMNPNPDLRYQTAEEMLEALNHLRENDPRVLRRKRQCAAVYAVLTVCFALGIISAFIGLKRMQTTEEWLKLAEYAQDALSEGDTAAAIQYALQSLPAETSLLQPEWTTESQRVLTEALGVYDLSDGYKTYETVELPSEPLYLAIAPDGETAACIYAYSLAVIDTERCEILATLPTESSALSEVAYLDGDTVLYAGSDGLTAYSIAEGRTLWVGNAATSLCISEDGSCVAAIYKDDPFATVYNAADGSVMCVVDFDGRCQRVTVNDSFANPNDNLLALSRDGGMLAVSFADGSLRLYDLTGGGEVVPVLDETSGYTHFEGGFFRQYFAFSASSSTDSGFAIINTDTMTEDVFPLENSAYSVQTDANGIYVQLGNILVQIDPDTGDQTGLVTTAENILHYATDGTHTLISSATGFLFFDGTASLISEETSDTSSDFLCLAGETALVGSRNSAVIRILRYEGHEEAELFSYDYDYDHGEARVSADGTVLMLFSYDQFRLYNRDGDMLAEVDIPDAANVYDQQYIRDEDGSRLEVTYNDGRIAAYSGLDGTLLWEGTGETPDASLEEHFETEQFSIVAPLHGDAEVYSLETGELFCMLEEDAYLTYVTQVGDNIVVQYITTDGYYYGQLLNEKCEVLADLPYLCDVRDDTLYFDYPSGNLRQSRIYHIDELIQIAQK
ncbi:MAG: WD40 repeat domain-containing serine/threonine protein kinase [Clostridiales bacterium]|nr:WD40 repeat domain-containing serine/threonine protein kinase [Clostridiales bacterium]